MCGKYQCSWEVSRDLRKNFTLASTGPYYLDLELDVLGLKELMDSIAATARIARAMIKF